MTGHEPPPGDPIVLDVHGEVATLWLNRPDRRNAMTLDMWAELGEIVGRLAGDRFVRLLVVRGAGGAFCAGADIGGLDNAPGRSYAEVNRAAEDALAPFPKPTIAFVDGACVGGGVQIALACDLRIGTTAARLGITPARLGILFPAPSLQRVVRRIGASATKALLFTAEIVGADRAQSMGLLDEVHPLGDAEQRLAELCAVIASRSSFTQQASKQMIDRVERDGVIDAAVIERWSAELARGEDRTEGVAAFLEHRQPRFTWSGG